jgi:ribosomal protein L7/L12
MSKVNITCSEAAVLLDQLNHVSVMTLRDNQPLFSAVSKLMKIKFRTEEQEQGTCTNFTIDTAAYRSFKVFVKDKINAIKMTRKILNTGLKEAKDYVDAGNWCIDWGNTYVLFNFSEPLTVNELYERLGDYSNLHIEAIK